MKCHKCGNKIARQIIPVEFDISLKIRFLPEEEYWILDESANPSVLKVSAKVNVDDEVPPYEGLSLYLPYGAYKVVHEDIDITDYIDDPISDAIENKAIEAAKSEVYDNLYFADDYEDKYSRR